MHGKKEFASAVFQIAIMFYCVSIGPAAMYFNWQYANQEGFIRWFWFGEVVATAKGLVWPYFVLESSCSNSQATTRFVAPKPDTPKGTTTQPLLIARKPSGLPHNVTAHYNRGVAYMSKQDFDNAITDFTEVIRLNPKDADAYGGRGTSYRKKGSFDNAIADLTQAIRLNPMARRRMVAGGLLACTWRILTKLLRTSQRPSGSTRKMLWRMRAVEPPTSRRGEKNKAEADLAEAEGANSTTIGRGATWSPESTSGISPGSTFA